MDFISKFVSTNTKGSALVFALVILAFSLVSALSIAAVSLTESKSSLSTEKSNRAFQVADSGLEKILYAIYKENDVNTPDGPKYKTLNALAGAIGSNCNSGKISGSTNTGDYKISFYDKNDAQFTVCGNTNNNSDWRTEVKNIKVEGTSDNTTRAVEAGLSSLRLVSYIKDKDTSETSFSPGTLTVKKDNVVFFKNETSGAIQLCFSSGPLPLPPCNNISSGDYWSYKFDTTGTYNYLNTLDVTDTGTIEVQ